MVDQTILRALDKDPEARFESADEMRAALEAALREPDRIRRRRRRMGVAALIAMTVGLSAAVAFAAKKPDVRARAMALAAPVIAKFTGTAPAPAEAVAQLSADPAAEPEAAEPTAEEEAAAPAEAPTAAETPDTADEAAGSDEATGSDEASDGDEAADPAEEKVAAAGADEKEEGNEADKASGSGAPAELFAAAPVSDDKAADDIEGKIQEAQDLMNNGQKVKGFNALRRLGKNHRKDARVLKAWYEAAVQMKGWGEAHRIARQWAAVEKTPESRVQLARMQRAVGKRKAAIGTLNALLTERPGHEEARQMLRSLTGTDTQLAQR